MSTQNKTSTPQLGYLARPYSDPNPKIKQLRYQIVNYVVLALLKQGKFIYSPLTHNVVIDQLGLHEDWEYWNTFDHLMLTRCDYLLVLKQQGWENSKGLAAELEYANSLGMDIQYMELPAKIISEAR